MQFVVMLDRSAGNESVGEMWTETKVFNASATLADVDEWVRSRTSPHTKGSAPFTSQNVRIQGAQ